MKKLITTFFFFLFLFQSLAQKPEIYFPLLSERNLGEVFTLEGYVMISGKKKNLVYKSLNPEIATINQGKVTTKRTGKVWIEATTPAGSSPSKTIYKSFVVIQSTPTCTKNIVLSKKHYLNTEIHTKRAIIQSSDGHYVDVSSTRKGVSGISGIIIAKMHISTGDIIWQKTISVETGIITVGVTASYINQDKEGNYIITGRDDIPEEDRNDLPDKTFSFIMKLDGNGNKLWIKKIRDKINFPTVMEDREGNYVLLYNSQNSVMTYSMSDHGTDHNPPKEINNVISIVKLNKDGDRIMEKTIPDIVVGTNKIFHTSHFLIEDDYGNYRIFGSGNYKKGRYIHSYNLQTSPTGVTFFEFSGFDDSEFENANYIYSLKIDAINGGILSKKIHKVDIPRTNSHNTYSFYLTGTIQTKGGDYLTVGSQINTKTQPRAGGVIETHSLRVIKMDNNLNMIWSKGFSNIYWGDYFPIIEDKYGDYLIGFKDLKGMTGPDGERTVLHVRELMKIDAFGELLWRESIIAKVDSEDWSGDTPRYATAKISSITRAFDGTLFLPSTYNRSKLFLEKYCVKEREIKDTVYIPLSKVYHRPYHIRLRKLTLSSSDSTVAIPDGDGRLRLLSCDTTVIELFHPGSLHYYPIRKKQVLIVTKGKQSLENIPTKIKLASYLLPDTTYQGVKVTYEIISGGSIAEISSSKSIEPSNWGTIRLKATAPEQKKYFSFEKIQDIEILKPIYQVYFPNLGTREVGKQVVLSGSAKKEDGRFVSITYSSSNQKVASILGNKIITYKPGKVWIRMKADGVIGFSDLDMYKPLVVVEATSSCTESSLFSKTYDDIYSLQGSVFLHSKDNNYVVFSVKKEENDLNDYQVMNKLDAEGNILSSYLWESRTDQKLHSAVEDYEGNYITTGSFFNDGAINMFVVKWSSTGQILWDRIYEFYSNKEPYSVIQDRKGEYILTGYIEKNYDDKDIFVMKLDKLGNMIWEKIIELPGNQYAHSIIQNSNGKYIVSGYEEKQPDIIFIYSLDSYGRIEKREQLKDSDNQRSYSMIEDRRDDYVIAGYKDIGNNKSILIDKFSSSLSLKWENSFLEESNQEAHTLIEDRGGEYLIGGHTTKNDEGDIFINKLDIHGDFLWERVLKLEGRQRFFSLLETFDGGYIMAVNSDDNLHLEKICARKFPQILTFTEAPAMRFGDTFVPFVSSSKGLEKFTFSSDDKEVVFQRNNIISFKKPGFFTITAHQEGNINYLPATASVTIVFLKKEQNISLPKKLVYNPITPYSLPDKTDQGLAVQYKIIKNPDYAQLIEENQIKTIRTGTITVEITTLDSDIYKRLKKTEDIEITKAEQYIIFLDLPPELFEYKKRIPMEAISTSGLSLRYESNNDRVVIDGDELVIKSIGEVKITAYQEGDINYLPATPVTNDMKVFTNEGNIHAIKAFPNPTTDLVSFLIKDSYIGDMPVHIYSVFGALLNKYTFEKKEVMMMIENVDISNFPKGVYIFSFYLGDIILKAKVLKE